MKVQQKAPQCLVEINICHSLQRTRRSSTTRKCLVTVPAMIWPARALSWPASATSTATPTPTATARTECKLQKIVVTKFEINIYASLFVRYSEHHYEQPMVIMPSRSPVDSIVKPLISDTSSSSTGGNFKAHYYLVTAGSGQDPAPLAIRKIVSNYFESNCGNNWLHLFTNRWQISEINLKANSAGFLRELTC